ncbi:hypothetical protein FRB99_008351 [Tulasnella sp. 403]|nr:hypothetical protein FRB99_008351 [Tulasnella sp. 403]
MSTLSKVSADRQKRALTELLALPGNNTCADCLSPAPRWTSWNLGIFICVNCATAHRKLGSHVSKVKSVTLDTWTKEQVESMKNMGNIKANALYNPDPLRNPPPTNMEDGERDSELEKYIRNKYQYKTFMKRETVPPSSSRTPDISIRTTGTSNGKSRTSPVPAPGPNYREVIDAVSPSASSLMADMEWHTRELSRGNRNSADRSRSTPPDDAPKRPVFGAKLEYRPLASDPTPRGVTRPSTASGGLPTITATPPATKKAGSTGGGFSWASAASQPSTSSTTAPTARPQPELSATTTSAMSTTRASTLPPAAVHAAPAPPVHSRSLFEEDMLSLQFGAPSAATASAPTASTNPFPTAPSAFLGGQTAASPFTNPLTGAASPFGGMSAGVQPLTTGLAGMNLNATNPGFGAAPTTNAIGTMGGMAFSPGARGTLSMGPAAGASPFGANPANPFNALQQSTSPPPMTSPFVQPQQNAFQPNPQNPFGMLQARSPPPQLGNGLQSSTSPFQPSTTPFQGTTSPFQNPQVQSPFGTTPLFQQPQQTSSFPSFSTSSFASPSPFQSQQQQLPQFTGAMGTPFGGVPTSPGPSMGTGNAFAAFAQNMLPPTQKPQVQPNPLNPFGQPQQMGMGVNGWMT